MKRGFTLIELLIVVAIIAILAAIAVPNFLEAQTRSKISRAKADMRSLATAIEAYSVDNNAYPKCNNTNLAAYRLYGSPNDTALPAAQGVVLEHLSTPIAYITTGLLADPFPSIGDSSTINPSTGGYTLAPWTSDQKANEAKWLGYAVTCEPGGSPVQALTDNLATSGKRFWAVWSAGPVLVHAHLAGTGLLNSAVTAGAIDAWIYDPTNGTVSPGNIWRMGGSGIYPPDPGGLFFSEVSTKQK